VVDVVILLKQRKENQRIGILPMRRILGGQSMVIQDADASEASKKPCRRAGMWWICIWLGGARTHAGEG
jgi:hypothetical protein